MTGRTRGRQILTLLVGMGVVGLSILFIGLNLFPLNILGYLAIFPGFVLMGFSGIFRYVFQFGAVVFFLWSVWALASGQGDRDLAAFGLWFGPMCFFLGYTMPVREPKA